MPIRWSARQVSQNLDELERLLKEAEPKLGECVAKASETAKLPNVPEYMAQPLMYLGSKVNDILIALRSRIEATRGYIPKEALAKDQVEFDRLVGYFNGDTAKAETAINLTAKPKRETPKEQIAMGWTTGKPTETLTTNPAQSRSWIGGEVQKPSDFKKVYAPGGEEPQLPERIGDDGTIAVSEWPPSHEVDGKEICYVCGRSVERGSGGFVNRAPSLDSQEDRREMGVPYPEGGYSCEECDACASDGYDTIEFYRDMTLEERQERGIPDDFEERCNALDESDDSDDGDGETNEQRIDRQSMAIDKAYDEGMDRKLLKGVQGELLPKV